MTNAKAARLLREQVERSNLRTVASKLNCSLSFVSYLANGKKRPGLRLATRIQDEYGIPATWWSPAKRSAA